jgi:hypothetical protein
MHEDYAELKRAVEEAGCFTTFMPISQPGDRIVCASRKRADGRALTGVSFWVAKRDGRWYLGMWGGELFRFSDASVVIPLCVRFVTDEKVLGSCLRVPVEVQAEVGLIELSEEEADVVFPPGE